MGTKSVKLGPLENLLLFTLEEQGSSFFNFQKARKILRVSDSSVRNVISRLKRKNRITEIGRGKYAFNPAKSGLQGNWAQDASLVVQQKVDSYYVAFWSALSHWGFTEQVPRVLFIATPSRKKDFQYRGQKIKFVTISKRRFFGFLQVENDEERFNVASREKAILDALLLPRYCGGMAEVTKALWYAWDDIDRNVLLECIDKVKTDSAKRRLGYLLGVLDIGATVRKQLKRSFSGFRLLDPSAPKTVKGYSKEWGLQLNLTKEELLSWRGS